MLIDARQLNLAIQHLKKDDRTKPDQIEALDILLRYAIANNNVPVSENVHRILTKAANIEKHLEIAHKFRHQSNRN